MLSLLNQEQMNCFKMVKQILKKSVKIDHLVHTTMVHLYGCKLVWMECSNNTSTRVKFGISRAEASTSSNRILIQFFSKAELNWMVTVKEEFPIISPLGKTDYIFRRLNGLECIVNTKISLAILLLTETQRGAQLRDSIGGA